MRSAGGRPFPLRLATRKGFSLKQMDCVSTRHSSSSSSPFREVPVEAREMVASLWLKEVTSGDGGEAWSRLFSWVIPGRAWGSVGQREAAWGSLG